MDSLTTLLIALAAGMLFVTWQAGHLGKERRDV